MAGPHTEERHDRFGDFPSTHWSLIYDAARGSQALEKLLRRYDRPLKGYLGWRFNLSEADAADLFQDFVLEVVLKREILREARQLDGTRFRSYLLRALHNFTISRLRARSALKRGPKSGAVSLDEAKFESGELGGIVSATGRFELEWGRAVLDQALELMRNECEAKERHDIWTMFEKRLRGPILDGVEPSPYTDLVSELNLKSPAQAQNLLITAKRMFERCLLEVISGYVLYPKEVQEELKELHRVLSSKDS